jgi:hypothetical protein
MMISRVLGDISCQLRHFDFLLKLSLEAGIYDLSLAWFETINEGGDRTEVVCN